MNNKYQSFSPLTLSQKEIYFDHLRYEDSPLYNIGGYLVLTNIQIERIRWAHKYLLEQEQIFKLKIAHHQGVVGQYVDYADDYLEVIDFSNSPSPMDRSKVYVETLFSRPMKIIDSPLFTSLLINLGNGNFWYVGLAHHIILDGWGFSNWAKKLARIYNTYPEFSEEAPQAWLEISAQDMRYLDSKKYLQDQAFWKKMFTPQTERLFAPLDNKQTENLTSTRESSALPKDLVETLQLHCKYANVNIGSLLLSLLSVYFSKYYDQERVLFAVPIHNRRNAIHKKTLGVFTGINPLIVQINKKNNITELAQQLDRDLKKCYRHQRYPFSHIISQALQITTDQSPYEIRYNFLDLKSDGLSFGGNSADLIYLGNGSQSFPLSFTVLYNDQRSDIELLLDYSHAFFTREAINKLFQRFEYLIQQFCENPSLNINEQEVISPAELALLIPAQHSSLPEKFRGKAIHERFEEMTEQFPSKMAICSENSYVTYEQLNHEANAIAKAISASVDRINHAFIGIYMDRSPQTLAAILGVLKSGAAYVPLDQKYPKERIKYIINDAKISAVITNISTENSLFTDIKVINLASLEDVQSTNTNLTVLPSTGNLSESVAYVIYTSGSTGKPKGVQIKHSSVLALLSWVEKQYQKDELAMIMASTSINFDLSIFELFSAVCLGHSCKIVPDAISVSPEKIKDITLINTVPSAIKTMLDLDLVPEKIKVINLAGEVLTKELVNEIFAKTNVSKIYNLYGPSEDTTYSTYAVYKGPTEDVPLIGKPIDHTGIHVLSKEGDYLPYGATGELYLSGLGLAKGYLNSPTLTAKKFIEHNGCRLYKTGDLVRLTEDGSLQFIGRIDEQIKINGFRVELEEVEYQLRAFDGVLHAVVLVKQTSTLKTLVAYVVHEQTDIPANEFEDLEARMREQLKQKLPSYMLPAKIIFLKSLPLNINGKTDKQALLKLELKTYFTPPISALEKQLAEIWSKLFEVDDISIDSDFFQLGGNSLLLTQMIHQLEQSYDILLAVKDVYRCPTIKRLATHLANLEPKNSRHFCVINKANQKKIPLTFSQYRVWFTEKIQLKSNQHNMAGSLIFTENKELEYIAEQLRQLLKQHIVFGCRIELDNEMPFFCLTEFSDEIVSIIDLSKLESKQADVLASQYRKQHNEIHFDIQGKQLSHFQLIKLTDNKIQFDFNIHHVIADGWSVSLLLNQLFESLNSPNLLEQASKFNFFDYALWETHFVTTDEYRKQGDFWEKYLEHASTRLTLPCNVSGEILGQFPTKLTLTPKILTRLHEFARQNKATPFNVIHSVLAILFARLSQQLDLNIAIPTAGRDIAGTEDIFGNFVNILPVRSQLDLTESFSVVLKKQVKNVRTVLANSFVPFQNIIERAAPGSRSINTSPLVQVALNWVNVPPFTEKMNKQLHTFETFDDIDAKFDLTFYINENQNGLTIKANYNPEKYNAPSIHILLQQLQELLIAVMAKDISCSRYSLALATQFSQVELPDLSRALVDNYQLSVIEMFKRQVEKNPQVVALQYAGHSLSYQRLDEITNYYADLLEKQGITTGDVVTIAAQRNDRLVIAILSVLKLRAAFCLVTMEHNPEVFERRLAQVNGKLVIVLGSSALEHQAIKNAANSGQIIVSLDHPYTRQFVPLANRCFNPDDIAYITQTSGTQGKAKLIKGRLSSLTFNLQWMADKFNFGENKKTAMLSALEHDPLQRDIFTTLCTGGTLVIPSEAENEPGRLQRWLYNEKINVVNLTPGYATYLWKSEPLANPFLKTIVFGGEALTAHQVKMIRQVNPDIRAFNVYGTTETCRALAYYEIPPQRDLLLFPTTFPIGKGMQGCQILVLNKHRQPCGIGERGEIAIRSHHLSLGYCDEQNRGNDNFIVNSISQDSSDQLYMTGDLGYYQADGNVIYQGRADQQVNLRGFRMELTSIEHVILQNPTVATAKVIMQGTDVNNQYLTAFVVLKDHLGSDAQELKSYLSRQLPAYMIPSQIKFLRYLPLTANGKIDIRQLSKAREKQIQQVIVNPSTPLETQLHAIWMSVLGKDQVCVNRDLFDLGGHSLNATTLIAKINQSSKVKITHLEFFNKSSIREVAKLIKDKNAKAETARGKSKQSLII